MRGLNMKRTHMHASPPCTRLSQVNTANPDTQVGLRLVRWYLDQVVRLKPRSWSMEQVNHPAVRALLEERGISYAVVNAIDFGVPQSRVRIVAGSPHIVAAMERRKGTGPTVLPKDVLALKPASRFMLTSVTSNQPIHVRRNGERVTVGYRPMRDDEGARDLCTPSHTVWGKPGKVFDRLRQETVRRLTPAECTALQGFPPTIKLDERSKARRACVNMSQHLRDLRTFKRKP
jgi:site-specific DNA-cytosine methylase